MNYKNIKRAFSLLELVFVILIGSIIVFYSTIYTKELYENQVHNQELAMMKLDLNSAKIIIEKNLPSSKNKLLYKEDKLFYENSILLERVSSFSMIQNANILKIKIELDKKIVQEWSFVL
ncbi:prepilin-type N-terminal cleavage/methylation domain-containing protein [Halarcobacter bivalviorum]|uniref:Type II secretion system protein n=1 Tax=Halarcobacter bivalviorum TaxID=663364 RepID=A0AAX2A776_9BACT|nr:prepilin-type N-terminal cleavage/methylation domain-containing protein [Halarcobacter bivalviorum]AXH11645.1 hypothetical protein ABIV_0632 [Halarcobacter bivalviorum]RXK08858.1 hypothetical protein CRV05_13080 [Halarcobacter bivalviorum]